MQKSTSITLDSHFQNFISEIVKSGKYGNPSEVVKVALKLLEDQETKKEAIIKVLKEGEESGFVEDFNSEILLDEIHKKNNVK